MTFEIVLRSVLGLFDILFLLFLCYRLLIYPAFLCNTRHIPGPYVSKVTRFWFTYQGYRNNSNQYVHVLHSKYGPVVRVAPNVVSFNTVEAIPAIYGVRSDFPKPPSAAAMNNYEMPNTFSTASNEDHRRRRSRYASTYSASNMAQGRGYDGIAKRTQQFVARIRRAAKDRRSLDIYKDIHYYAVDNASVIACGTSMGLLDGENRRYSQDLRSMFSGLAYVFYFPLVSKFLRILPEFTHCFIPKPVLESYEAHTKVQHTNWTHFCKSRDPKKMEFDKSVLARLVQHRDFGSHDLTNSHVASEISDHLIAGADTLVAGLVYILWELARPQNKAHLDRLVVEMQSICCTDEGVPAPYVMIKTQQWLQCCIYEGLRLHTPSGNIQSRIVPKGGASIARYLIPETTEVGVSLYSIHLNANIFQDPHSFKPERWLVEKADTKSLRNMKLAWIPFGYGARICVGKELAMVEMKLLLAMILRDFSVSLDNSQDQDEMEGIQMAVLTPKGGRCLLRFSEHKEKNTW